VYAVAGGLLSYGLSFSEAYRQIGVYAGRIRSDAKPEALPVVCRRRHLGIVVRELARHARSRKGTIDHVHMLISIPPKYSVAEVIGDLKGKRRP
jgi:uncharacterized protein (DUF58 family)